MSSRNFFSYAPRHPHLEYGQEFRELDTSLRTWQFPMTSSGDMANPMVGIRAPGIFLARLLTSVSLLDTSVSRVLYFNVWYVPVPLWEKCHLCAWHKGIDRLQQASDMPASIKKAISWSRWFNKDWLHQQAFICSSVLRCTITLEYMFCILSEWFKSNSLDFRLARADNSKVQAEDFPFSTCQSAASINILLESSGLRASKQPLSITWARQNPCFRHWKQDRLIQQCMPSVRAASNVPLLKGSVLRAGFTRSKKYHVKNNTITTR